MKTFKEFMNEAQYDIADVDDGIEMFLKIANDSLTKGEMAQFNKDRKKRFVAVKKQKYTAIYNEEFGKITSIHAFIDNLTGAILKPAGFKKPAKGPRGNITDSSYLARLKNGGFDPYGGYLYMRR